jgi:hypothetical protein
MMKLAIKSISVGVLMAASMSASAFTFPDILASQGRVEYRPNSRTAQSNQPVPAISSNIITIADRAVIRDISREDLEEMKLISRRVLQKLPTEQQIANLEIRNPADRQLQVYIRQGRMAIKKMASDAEQLSPEEASNLYSQLQQAEQSLLTLSNNNIPAATSCIGTAESEKKGCLETCKGSGKKFCGCYWNSFLAKANCFFPSKV